MSSLSVNSFVWKLNYSRLAAHPFRGVAQLAEQRAHNPRVAGSNPAPATLKRAGMPRVPVCQMRIVQNDTAFISSLDPPWR